MWIGENNMISWITLFIGMFIGYALGVLSARNQSPETSGAWKEALHIVKDGLSRNESFSVHFGVSRFDDDDDNDNKDVKLVPSVENIRFSDN